MAKVNHVQQAFNAGELSPKLTGRNDFEKYSQGACVMENLIPTVQGTAVKRGGTKYAAVAKTNFSTVLIPFKDTNGTNYIIEAGNQYFRFFKADGTVIGAPFELATTYTSSDVYQLQYTQINDVLYIVGNGRPPRKLTKNSATDNDWTIADVTFDWPPFRDINNDETAEFYVSASTGTGITITAVGHTPFNAGLANAGIHIKITDDASKELPWVASTTGIGLGSIRRFGDNVYEQTSAGGTTGTLPPTHTAGTVNDGAVDWLYLHSGVGYIELKSFTSSTQMTADVKARIPDSIVGSGNETYKWAYSSWGNEPSFGYPYAVAIFEDRLIFAGSDTEPQTIWGSVVGDYENHKTGTTDSDAWQYTIGSEDLNTIKWMVPSRVLMIGTDFAEFTMSGSRIYESITPTNVRLTRQTSFGSNVHRPKVIGNRVLVTEADGRKVREFSYDYDSDSYIGVDRTVLSEHITSPSIRQGERQKSPFPILWYPRYDNLANSGAGTGDGELIGITYDHVESVYSWHRHPVGGDGFVESVAVLPNGSSDQVWLVVKRTINGAESRYIEYFDPPVNSSPEDSYYLDCGITYDGASNTTITGLSHLEGETVQVLADGSAHADKTVSSGQITLDFPASKVHVGYGYNANLQTMPIVDGGNSGIAAGQNGRITTATLRVLSTGAGLWLGSDTSNLTEINFRDDGMDMDAAVPLFTGLKGPKEFDDGYQRELKIYVQHRLPLPFELLSIIADMDMQNK